MRSETINRNEPTQTIPIMTNRNDEITDSPTEKDIDYDT